MKAASSPARSEKAVKPTMSVNRTVTCRRSASTLLPSGFASKQTVAKLHQQEIDRKLGTTVSDGRVGLPIGLGRTGLAKCRSQRTLTTASTAAIWRSPCIQV